MHGVTTNGGQESRRSHVNVRLRKTLGPERMEDDTLWPDSCSKVVREHGTRGRARMKDAEQRERER